MEGESELKDFIIMEGWIEKQWQILLKISLRHSIKPPGVTRVECSWFPVHAWMAGTDDRGYYRVITCPTFVDAGYLTNERSEFVR